MITLTLLGLRKVLVKYCRENKNHFVFQTNFPFFLINHAIYKRIKKKYSTAKQAVDTLK